MHKYLFIHLLVQQTFLSAYGMPGTALSTASERKPRFGRVTNAHQTSIPLSGHKTKVLGPFLLHPG